MSVVDIIRHQFKTGLDLYRFEGQVPRRTLNQGIWKFTNVLPWWKQKQGMYPTLAALAKKYLAIEATSVASERLFSKARRITTGDRNGLVPEVVVFELDWSRI